MSQAPHRSTGRSVRYLPDEIPGAGGQQCWGDWVRGSLVVVIVPVVLGVLYLWASDRGDERDPTGMPETAAQRAIVSGDTRKLRAEAIKLDLDLHGGALLCNAASAGQVDAMRILLELGVDPNVAFPNGQTPLIAAAVVGRTDAVKCLLAAGADPRRRLATGQDALTVAERAGHEDTAAVIRAFTRRDEQ